MANAVEDSEIVTNSDKVANEESALTFELEVPKKEAEGTNDGSGDVGGDAEIKLDTATEVKEDTDSIANADANVDANADAKGDADAKEDADEDKIVDQQADADADEDREVDRHADADADEDREVHRQADAVADVDADEGREVDQQADAEVYPDEDTEVYPEDDGEVYQDAEAEVDGDEIEENEKVEKPLDDDQDRRNPQYIPKGGAFYEHDNRTSLEDVENKDPLETDKKKKSWKESKESERWLHDCYNETEQLPKSTAEILETYGYDIRKEDSPPRARRRRKYGRGPDKYERSWEDEEAYLIKQNNIARRGKKKPLGREEFPPLPNQKFDSGLSKPSQKPSSWKNDDEDLARSRNSKLNGNEKMTRVPPSRSDHSGQYNNLPSFHSGKKNYTHPIRKMNDDDIKPFRTDGDKWKNSFKQGKTDGIPKPMKTQPIRQNDHPFKKQFQSSEGSIKEPDVSHITDGLNQMTFHNRQTNLREVRSKPSNGPEEKINEREIDSSTNRQKPKRYSKIRKGFTGIFPPEEVPELDQAELKLQEQQKNQHLNLTQPMNMQNVLRQYAGTYRGLDFVPGNTNYLGARPIMSGIPQQGMSPQGLHQQTLSPQAIPQQALSPQVTDLQTLELQQNPLAQPNFVPQPMYINMDPHYTSDVIGPFTSYPAYSGNQTRDVYQPSSGITYYSPECQNSGQKRPPPAPRQKAAIPIVRPSD